MNLDEFLEDIRPEAQLSEATEQDTEKFIKNLDSVRLNIALKNRKRIASHMRQLASSMRGVVKTVLLRGAVDAFKKSRTEAVQLRRDIDDKMNKYVEKTVDLLTKAKDKQDAIDKIDKNESKFRNIFDDLSDAILNKYNEVDDELIKRNSIAINVDKLETSEEKNYATLAGEIIEYYVRELLKIRAILSAFQTFLARVRKKSGEMYDSVLLDEFPPMFKSYLKGKFGAETGKYLSAHVERYYSMAKDEFKQYDYDSTADRKKEFYKFENLLNYLLGVTEEDPFEAEKEKEEEKEEEK